MQGGGESLAPRTSRSRLNDYEYLLSCEAGGVGIRRQSGLWVLNHVQPPACKARSRFIIIALLRCTNLSAMFGYKVFLKVLEKCYSFIKYFGF
jgi:hypothetical protein